MIIDTKKKREESLDAGQNNMRVSTGEYIKRFPTKLHNMLLNPEIRGRFEESMVWEYEDVAVYRGLHRADEIKLDDFLGNLDEAEIYNIPVRRATLKMCAVSVNEDPKQIIKALHIPNHKRPALGIAKGYMRCTCDPADFEDGKTHHNWYLYKDKIEDAAKSFQVEEFNQYG